VKRYKSGTTKKPSSKNSKPGNKKLLMKKLKSATSLNDFKTCLRRKSNHYVMPIKILKIFRQKNRPA